MSDPVPSPEHRALAAAFAERSVDALRTARHDLPVSPVAAVNRSYYAAFYAASAVFALEGRTFTRHTAVRSALHKDLVSPGRIQQAIGEAFDGLFDSRGDGDYDALARVTAADASIAIEQSEKVTAVLLALFESSRK
ncbi:MAG TPA: HEPN domain-containing protein [Phycisphaerales bacterium]|nr:HEPN domain-containing protein [Phycisphaerales bacterium]